MSQPVILCLDDEKIVTDTLITQLANAFGEDFYFEAASEVDEAWEILEELEAEGQPLALVISDWLMPQCKGDVFLAEVNARWPDLPLIMLSGQADEEAIHRLETDIPFFTFLKKPWNRDELVNLIRQKTQRQPQ
jgi:DNA-binding NtrC family response regulator